jgi:hypothetical protein
MESEDPKVLRLSVLLSPGFSDFFLGHSTKRTIEYHSINI